MEQLSIWDFIFANQAENNNFSDFEKKESIGSLVREVARKARKREFLDYLKGKDFSKISVFKATKSVASKILKKCEVSESCDIYMEPIKSLIAPFLWDQFKIDIPTDEEDELCRYVTKCKSCIAIQIDDDRYVGPLDKPLSERKDLRSYRFKRRGASYVSLIDLPRFFSKLLIVSEIDKYYEERIKNLNSSELEENVVYKTADDLVTTYYKEPKILKDYLTVELLDYLESKGLNPVQSKEARGTVSVIYYPAYMYFGGHLKELIKVSFGDCISGSESKIFEALVREYDVEKTREEYLRNLSSDYALSFQDKKNIPAKYSDAAASSFFRKVFGYVEYDESTDIEKLTQLQNEFMAIMNYFGNPCLDQYSIRFRKLGHHKASGLYYPTMNCLCVDIRTPSSFTHEFFHLMDFKNGELSLKSHFLAVRNMYEKCLRDLIKSLNDGDSIKKVLTGNTKYNLKYYLEPTEIFARAGELYMLEFVGIRNSLNDYVTSFAYPRNEDFLMEVKKYFDYFFESVLNIITSESKMTASC